MFNSHSTCLQQSPRRGQGQSNQQVQRQGQGQNQRRTEGQGQGQNQGEVGGQGPAQNPRHGQRQSPRRGQGRAQLSEGPLGYVSPSQLLQSARGPSEVLYPRLGSLELLITGKVPQSRWSVLVWQRISVHSLMLRWFVCLSVCLSASFVHAIYRKFAMLPTVQSDFNHSGAVALYTSSRPCEGWRVIEGVE